VRRRTTILLLAALVGAAWAGALVAPALPMPIDQDDESNQHGMRPDFAAPRVEVISSARNVEYTGISGTRLDYPDPVHDIGMGSVLAPPDTVLPEQALAPIVIVQNRGDYLEQDVRVYCRIDSAGTPVYRDSVLVTLDSAKLDTLEFSMWNAGPGGQTYQLTFWHAHPPDTIHGNDTARTSTWTLHNDVATTNINVDTVMRSARWFVPIITIENIGGYDAFNFLVHCVIDSSGDEIYSELVEVDTLLRHQTKTVPFPAWMVGPDGAVYGFKMYHDASGDGDPTNDTLAQLTRSSLGMLRIAVEISAGSRGRNAPNACYAIDSMRVGEGWGGGLVTGDELDEWDELMNYDVVVTGDDGFSDNDFAQYDQALLHWVKRGGGFVGLGWLVFGIHNGPGGGSPMDSVSAAKCNRDYAYVSSGQVRPLSNDHEITEGVGQFTIQDYGEYPQGGLWEDAVMLGDYTDNPGKPSIAYKILGDGRSVYLGPAYFADFASHQTEPYFRDGNAVRLLVQAIKWAASGPGVGMADASKSLIPARTGIASVRPNPLTGHAVVRYSLTRPGNVSLAVFDLTGQRVRTLRSGFEQAGESMATWNRSDDSGRQVPAGIYFCRFETEGKSDTRKLVVR
jgi:hypothetical protein